MGPDRDGRAQVSECTPPSKVASSPRSNRTYNALLTGTRAFGECANALLTQRWKVLRHIALSASRTGAIVVATLVLTTLDH